MWFLTQTRGINLVVITGNPVANKQTKPGSLSAYAQLESELNKNLSAVVINDLGLVDDQGFYLKRKAGQKVAALPYPNPIKLESNVNEGGEGTKHDYLNAADKMKNAAAINITDIRPDTNIGSEIFPKELT